MSHRETDSKVCLRTPNRVLIFDHPGIKDDLESTVRELGYAVERVDNLDEAISQFEERDFPVILVRTDEKGNGLEFVERSHSPRTTAFIAITTCAGCESAVLSLRAGARDYIVWPGCRAEMEIALRNIFDEVERSRFHDDMLCMLTHDIKIPLSSILGYSALVFDGDRKLNPRAEEFVKTINASGLKILTLIDNFLTTNKIDSGKLHLCLDEVDVGVFLQDMANTFHAELDRHKLTLELDCAADLPLIEADEGLLFRAVGNLLSNACKFSPEDTKVSMGARLASTGWSDDGDGAGLIIDVTNEGPGLELDEIPEIFERFRRGRAQYGIEGSGLGAYVIKSIVEAHRGKVNVASVPNGLTTFSICLPLKIL